MFRSLLLASVVFLGVVPASAQTVISNVKSWQEPGTHRIKITYDVAAGTTCTTALQASLDGGANYGLVIPPAAILPDSQLGPGMSGSGRTIEVNASKVSALDDIFTKNLRFKVVAYDVVPLGTMVLIPEGNFQMGNSMSPEEGRPDELPVHSVYVSKFLIQATEVTKEQWDQVRTWGLNNGYTNLPIGGETPWGANYSKGPTHPVVHVLWFDALKWCNALSEMNELTPCYTVNGGQIYKTSFSGDVVCNWNAGGYRLPTEAEWEKAARGGLSGKRFPWGDTINHTNANYKAISSAYSYDTSGYTTWTDHPDYNDGVYPYTSPVGSFPANGYGLYDMAGNMWEWCWDRYASYPSTSQVDPRGPSSGSARVVRGGNWYSPSTYCRVSSRNEMEPNYTTTGEIGFRIARSAVP